jgi:hypothetical protein
MVQKSQGKDSTKESVSSSLAICLLFIFMTACNSTREFWRYVVEDGVEKPTSEREMGVRDQPRVLSPHNVKVVYSDGSVSTEVLIPILSSGQQILIAHNGNLSPQALSVAPLPPTAADKSLEEAYVKSGQPVRQEQRAVSIIKTHERVQMLVKEGNYALALQYIEQLLKRYPNHAKSLRTKGSLLLKMGEREAALKAYFKAQEVEPDSRVEEQIQRIEKSLGNQ